MEPQTAPEAEPRGEAKPESRPDAGVRIVAHDHRRHDAPISTPVGFSSIPVERMKRLRFLEAVWVEDTVDVKVKGKSVGTGGLKMVQRAFQRAEGSIADDGGATGATDSGAKADWVAIVLKQYFGEALSVISSSSGRSSKTHGVLEQFKRDCYMQLETRSLAIAFSRAGPAKKIEVVEPCILTGEESGEVFFAEPFMVGEFFKHNDPAANILGMHEGFADDNNYVRMTPQAFSHFSWCHTGGRKLVMDVQGVGDVYTDPQIISAEGGRYGIGGLDSGITGLAFFACSHICNPICEELGLSPFHLSPHEIDRIALLWDDMKKNRASAVAQSGVPMSKDPERSTTWNSVMRRRRLRGSVKAVIAVNRFKMSVTSPESEPELEPEPEPSAQLEPEPEPAPPQPTKLLPAGAATTSDMSWDAVQRRQRRFRGAARAVIAVGRFGAEEKRSRNARQDADKESSGKAHSGMIGGVEAPPRNEKFKGAVSKVLQVNRFVSTVEAEPESAEPEPEPMLITRQISSALSADDMARTRRWLERSVPDRPAHIKAAPSVLKHSSGSSRRTALGPRQLGSDLQPAEAEARGTSHLPVLHVNLRLAHFGEELDNWATSTDVADVSQGASNAESASKESLGLEKITLDLQITLNTDAVDHEQPAGESGKFVTSNSSSVHSARSCSAGSITWADSSSPRTRTTVLASPLAPTNTDETRLPRGWGANSADGKRVGNLFELFKHICQTKAVDPTAWEQFGRLHARFWLWHHTNTHPYYHREGLWLSPLERARDGAVHLCYSVALMRALTEEVDSSSDADIISQESLLLEKIKAARSQADKVPVVVEWRRLVPEHDLIDYSLSIPHNHPAVRRWSAARDLAAALLLWCDHKGSNDPSLLGGPRRYVLVRQRPDGQQEVFAAVATEEEAARLCPEYMQDMGFAMGASFRRVKSGDYRFGDGGRLLGYRKATRLERKHWERSAFESIHRIITEGEATECNSTFGLNPHESAMDQWFEAARKRLVERSMGGGRAPVDTAGAEELEDQIDAAEISTGAFVAPLAVDAIGRSGGGGCCSSRPERLENPHRDESGPGRR